MRSITMLAFLATTTTAVARFLRPDINEGLRIPQAKRGDKDYDYDTGYPQEPYSTPSTTTTEDSYLTTTEAYPTTTEAYPTTTEAYPTTTEGGYPGAYPGEKKQRWERTKFVTVVVTGN